MFVLFLPLYYFYHCPSSIYGLWLPHLLVLQLPEQSAHIATNAVSSNPGYWDVYSIQHYVIKYISDLRQVGGFLHQ